MTAKRRAVPAAKRTADPWRNRIVGQGDEAPDQLLANPSNWRVHPKAQREALAAVLDDVGWVQRVIVNRTTQHVVDGHLRVALALSRDEPTIPVNYVELDEREEALVLAALDPIAAMAATDKDKLRELLEQAQVTDDQLREAISVAAGLPAQPTKGRTDPDAVPDERATEIERGDLFELGSHRLLCGDCTDQNAVVNVLQTDTPDFIFTDPPYGINYTYNEHKDTGGTDYTDWCDRWWVICEQIEAPIVITTGWSYMAYWWNKQPTDCLYWICRNKTSGGKASYLRKVEPMFVFKSLSEKYKEDYFFALNNYHDDMGKKGLHTCPKPVELVGAVIEPQTKINDIVFDPFLGSGTTLLVAEQYSRRCYGLEIDPVYCQVIIDRWEAFTGEKAKKVQP